MPFAHIIGEYEVKVVKMTAEIEALKEERDNALKESRMYQQAFIDPEPYRTDAERYRSLREHCAESYGSSEGCSNKDAYLTITGYDDQYPMTNEQKDFAVDAAIAQQKPIPMVTVATQSEFEGTYPHGLSCSQSTRQAIEQEDSNEQHLMNLLARIHGDGGHYVDEHGILQAVEVADKLVAQWRAIEFVAEQLEEKNTPK